MSENATIQINFKTKKDGMLINLRASDAMELDLLLDAISQRAAALVDLEATFEGMASPNLSQAAVNIAAAFPGSTVVSTTPTAPAFKPAVVGGQPECTCGGGPMRLVPAGIAKSTGRPYKAFYACPKPQGQSCPNKVPA
jgi:hypothetical protein